MNIRVNHNGKSIWNGTGIGGRGGINNAQGVVEEVSGEVRMKYLEWKKIEGRRGDR